MHALTKKNIRFAVGVRLKNGSKRQETTRATRVPKISKTIGARFLKTNLKFGHFGDEELLLSRGQMLVNGEKRCQKFSGVN